MSADLVQFAAGALVATVIIGLAWIASAEHSHRQAERAERAKLAEQIAALEAQIAALDRAKNGLYRESIEDIQARQLRAAGDVATGVEFMVQAIRILNPELLKKPKGSK